jgi:enoyl-CoA hydratase
MSYEFILVDAQVAPFVAKIQLNRPKELNALNLQLMGEIRDALLALDADDAVRAIVITGMSVHLPLVQISNRWQEERLLTC